MDNQLLDYDRNNTAGQRAPGCPKPLGNIRSQETRISKILIQSRVTKHREDIAFGVYNFGTLIGCFTMYYARKPHNRIRIDLGEKQ